MTKQKELSGLTDKKMKRRNLGKRVWQNRERYVLLLPVLILVLVFSYFPMYGITMAFKDFKIMQGIWGSDWVGLANFERLFRSPSFFQVMRNTIVISIYRLVFGFPAPILFAILVNEIVHTRFKKVVQTVAYLPHFMSWVVLGGVVRNLLSADRGIINYLIQLFGGEPIMFLTDTDWFRSILILSGIWQGVGWASIIYLATIAGIDPQLYEAAVIDGANRYQMAVKITIPSLYPVITIQLILSIGGILNAGFDQIFNLYSPMVYEVADILDTYVYRIGIAEGSDYSFATAVGLFKNVVGFGLVIFTNFVTKRISDNGIW